ncbi:hypothetical protein GALMADRAFT_235782 [Galerina marginata CBS 339.88]|uniref:Uncharacterized protein n=1 Tax=Galerina marginata (strain CBS 339.88) TaxID=685588 RepID=A0A067TK17_GALM3|nr:hypothetical protein GALMADRAFT_235782 [Galerina marginata CBS 339.88]
MPRHGCTSGIGLTSVFLNPRHTQPQTFSYSHSLVTGCIWPTQLQLYNLLMKNGADFELVTQSAPELDLDRTVRI